jgi:acyl-CoA thioester hydrolase
LKQAISSLPAIDAMSDFKDFPLKLDLRIDFSELDLFGHVNNVMFAKYVQAARVHYWEQIGLYENFKKTGIGPMLAAVTCNYFRPLFYPGNITMYARMEFIKNTSFGLHHLVINHKNQTAAEAHDVMVMYDFKREEKVLFPEDLRAATEAFENKKF